MPRDYFSKKNGLIRGPHTSAQVRAMVSTAELVEGDQISDSKQGPWRPIEGVRALKALMNAKAPDASGNLAGVGAPAFDVFVSFSDRDRPAADALVHELEARGVRCWISYRNISTGGYWPREILEGLNSSRVLVLVLSNSSNTSSQVRLEVERAVSKGLTIVPLRIEDVVPGPDLELFLSSRHWLDAFHGPLSEYLGGCADSIQAILQAPDPLKRVPKSSKGPLGDFQEAPRRKWTAVLMTSVALALLGVGWVGWSLRPEIAAWITSGPPTDQISAEDQARRVPLQAAVSSGLAWLAEHQSVDGCWYPRSFTVECDLEGSLANGGGDPLHRVGLTGMALLCFLGERSEGAPVEYRGVVERGLGWLIEQQDSESGLIGSDQSKEFIYNHAIGTQVLAVAAQQNVSTDAYLALEAAVDYCLKARNDYEAWRYSEPPNGENDMSVTGWFVVALHAAREAGISIGNDPFIGSLSIVEELTDSSTGRTGYLEPGQSSSRATVKLEIYPTKFTEAMTAAAIVSRVLIYDLLGIEGSGEMLRAGGLLLLECLPEWDPAGGGGGDSGWEEGHHGVTNDMYYWYYGTRAARLLGSAYWTKWRAAIEVACVENQRDAPPCYRGSWDPGGPWGYSGGRVYSTAMMVLCLEEVLREPEVLER